MSSRRDKSRTKEQRWRNRNGLESPMLRIEALTVGDLIMNIRYGLFARVCADQKNVERVCQPSPFKILVRLEKTIGKEGLHTWPIEDVRLVKKTRY